MPIQIPDAEKSARATKAKSIAAQMSADSRRRFIGRTMNVLFEHPVNGSDVWSGHSEFCFSVQAAHPTISKNKQLPVQITGLTEIGLSGKICL